jgi:transposase
MTMMTPPDSEVTGGVDTHGDVHVAAVLDSATGRLLGTASFDTTPAGYTVLLEWMEGHGRVSRVGCESTGSYGAGLCRFLTGEGVEVIDVDRPDRKTRRFDGKSDPIDAEAAARAVLAGTATGIPKSRDGLVEAIRVLEVTHDSAVRDRTRAINQFHALLASAPERIRARLRGETLRNQLCRARRFSDRGDDPVEAMTRLAMRELARRINDLDNQVARIESRLLPLTAQAAPALVGLKGVGPHVAAQLLAAAGDNPHRLASEAAFAKLCGVCPLPVTSGKTQGRHRLNRGGDRRANRALHTIVLVRMRYDARTRDYVERRTAEGKTTKEIMRCLKRFIAREVYQAIVNPPADLPSGAELRELRTERGMTLSAVAGHIGTFPTHLSQIERGLRHDTAFARAAKQLLQEDPLLTA